MKYCSKCAHPVIKGIPPDDNLERHICEKCGEIHYVNPKLVVCTIPMWEQDGVIKVLLCKRAIEPRHGRWTLPGGFMENNETTTEAAMRETTEEAGAHIEVQSLFALVNLPTYHQVHLFYLAKLIDLEFDPGPESQEVRLFSEEEIPWKQLAFGTVRQALRFFCADLATIKDGGRFGFHSYDLMESGFPDE